MADQKITELTEATSPADGDLLAQVQDVSTTPVTKKITWTTLKTFLKSYFDSLYLQKWTALSNFTATPASTSTITFGTDQTGTLKAGMPVKYTISSVVYYGIITAMTSNLMTIAGAPLGGDVTALSVGNPERVINETFTIPGGFADAADTDLLANDNLMYYYWDYAPAKLVKLTARVTNADSGAANSRVNFRIGTTTTDYVSTSNSNAGLTVTTSLASTVVDIDTSKYSITNGQVLEVKVDANGTNKDAKNLSIKAIFVLE